METFLSPKVAKKFEAGLRMESPHKQIRDYRLVLWKFSQTGNYAFMIQNYFSNESRNHIGNKNHLARTLVP